MLGSEPAFLLEWERGTADRQIPLLTSVIRIKAPHTPARAGTRLSRAPPAAAPARSPAGAESPRPCSEQARSRARQARPGSADTPSLGSRAPAEPPTHAPRSESPDGQGVDADRSSGAPPVRGASAAASPASPRTTARRARQYVAQRRQQHPVAWLDKHLEQPQQRPIENRNHVPERNAHRDDDPTPPSRAPRLRTESAARPAQPIRISGTHTQPHIGARHPGSDPGAQPDPARLGQLLSHRKRRQQVRPDRPLRRLAAEALADQAPRPQPARRTGRPLDAQLAVGAGPAPVDGHHPLSRDRVAMLGRSSASRVRENRTHGLKGEWGNVPALRAARP